MYRIQSLLVLFTSLLLISCGGNTKRIEIDGSSTVYPITEAVSEEFRSQAPNTRVTIGVSGTGGGFKKFIRGETDINNASRQISESERKMAEKNGVEFIELKVAFDGIAVVTNPDNDWAEYITTKELKKIWRPEAQKNVNTWQDVRKAWPDEPLHLYGPGVASGTYDYFTKAIVGEHGASRGDYTASEDDNVLVQGVAGDKFALGFFGLAYYEENSDKLKLIPVDNGKGEPVTPTIETIANNSYKPLSRPLYIYVHKDATQKEHVQQFVNYYLNNAGELAKQIGYVPMPDSLYQVQRNKFDSFAQTKTASEQK